jgi:hypothetical protein
MAISRMQNPRQLMNNGGILTLEAAKKMAPPGESLAYINKDEAKLLKSLGGAGEDINGTGIKSYFIKKALKKITRPIKKILKSPIGKIGLGALAIGGMGGFGGLGAKFGSLFGGKTLPPSMGFKSKGLFGLFNKAKGALTSGKGLLGIGAASGLLGGLFAKGADETEEEYQDRIVRLQPYLRQYYGNVGDTFGDQKMGPNELEDFVTSQSIEYQGAKDGGIIGAGGVTPEEMKKIKKSAEYKGWKRMYEMNPDAASGHEKHSEFLSVYKRVKKADGGKVESPAPMDFDMEEEVVEDISEPMTGVEKLGSTLNNIASVLYKVNPTIMPYQMAKAMYDRLPAISKQNVEETGRIMTQPEEDEVSETMIMVEGKKDGGIMNLGGKEMDLRGGGFVPLGKKERADDVPARLSKNEFVFTADAVRAAGGGSVQKGAQKMYDTMKMLEKRIR